VGRRSEPAETEEKRYKSADGDDDREQHAAGIVAGVRVLNFLLLCRMPTRFLPSLVVLVRIIIIIITSPNTAAAAAAAAAAVFCIQWIQTSMHCWQAWHI